MTSINLFYKHNIFHLLCFNSNSFRYYYNKETGATQWDRPVEMGEAPLATGNDRKNFHV